MKKYLLLLLVMSFTLACTVNKNDTCEGVDCKNGSCFIQDGMALCNCYENTIKINGICEDNNECTNGTVECNSGYHCIVLPDGNSGKCEDVNECDSETPICENGFKCINTGGSYQCIDKNECVENNPCGTTETCVNTSGSYSCVCKSGFGNIAGTCVDINECEIASDDCSDDGCCENIIGGFSCKCNEGFTGNGKVCVDVDECDEDTPWLNECSEYASCINISGGYFCECDDGFVGDGVNCIDIDECASNQYICDSTDICMNTYGSYDCIDKNECEENPCDDNAVCSNIDDGYMCTCNYGFEGDGTVCNEMCGNGIKTVNEECDTDDLNYNTCVSLGYSGGILKCSDSCEYNTTACYSSWQSSGYTRPSTAGEIKFIKTQINDAIYFHGDEYYSDLRKITVGDTTTITDIITYKPQYSYGKFDIADSDIYGIYTNNGVGISKNNSTIASIISCGDSCGGYNGVLTVSDSNIFTAIGGRTSYLPLMLTKHTLTGSMLWNRQIPNTLVMMKDIIKSTDCYYVLLSSATNFLHHTSTNKDIYIIKYDLDGNYISSNKYDNGVSNDVYQTLKCGDDIIVVSNNNNVNGNVIISFDESLNISWIKDVGIDLIKDIACDEYSIYSLNNSNTISKFSLIDGMLLDHEGIYRDISKRSFISIYDDFINIIYQTGNSTSGSTNYITRYIFEKF